MMSAKSSLWFKEDFGSEVSSARARLNTSSSGKHHILVRKSPRPATCECLNVQQLQTW